MTQRMNQLLHVRFDGRSEEVSFDTLHIARTATDAQIKAALARYFDLPVSHLDSHIVVRGSQAIVVRPEAIYG